MGVNTDVPTVAITPLPCLAICGYFFANIVSVFLCSVEPGTRSRNFREPGLSRRWFWWFLAIPDMYRCKCICVATWLSSVYRPNSDRWSLNTGDFTVTGPLECQSSVSLPLMKMTQSGCFSHLKNPCFVNTWCTLCMTLHLHYIAIKSYVNTLYELHCHAALQGEVLTGWLTHKLKESLGFG